MELRFLTHADFPQYTSLFNSSDYLMGLKKTDDKVSRILTSVESELLDPHSPARHVGVFNDDGELVASVCGRFFKTMPLWYVSTSLNKTAPGLNSYKKYVENFKSMMEFLMVYGENQGFYGFYAKRPYVHAKAFHILVEKFGDRYLVFQEAFYAAGAEVNIRQHMPMFGKDDPFVSDCIIYICLLRPELRIEKLHSIHSSGGIYDGKDFSTKS